MILTDDKWPHKFTRNGNGYELGPDETGRMKYAQTYVCVHCYQEYVQGFEKPKWVTEACPNRKTRTELKRLLN